MNNIIQLVAQKVKREIEGNLIKVLEGNTDLDHIVDSVGEMVNSIGIDTISAIIGEVNNIIKDSPERKGKYHVHKKSVKRSLITRFGELEFERTYFKNVKENSYVHILDEILGIEKYERIEANLKGSILEKSADVSYQKAAELSTPVALTRESVKRTIRENGTIDNLELEIKEKEKNKEVNTIYIEADEAVKAFKSLMEKYNIEAYDKKAKKGIIRNIIIRNNRKNEIMFIIVTRTENFKNKEHLVSELSLISNIKTIIQNINNKNTNLIMGRKNITLYGEGVINDTIDDLIFTISPETFFQINPAQTEKLYQTAIEYADIDEDSICFDIYCGIGTISLMAAKKAKYVYGVEIVEQSIINARENANKNNISNVEFYTGKAEEILPKLYKQGMQLQPYKDRWFFQ
jgi:23S rRNA (uracil-5-)-methyltransferase RumA